MNAENENGTLAGAALKTDYDEESVTDSYVSRQDAMNREYVRACRAAGIEPDVSGCRAYPQDFAGHGTEGGRGNEDGNSVPVASPPVESEPRQDLEPVRRALKVLEWIDRHTKTAHGLAGMVALGQSTLTPAEIAKLCRVSARRVQQLIAEAKRVLAEGELEAKP